VAGAVAVVALLLTPTRAARPAGAAGQAPAERSDRAITVTVPPAARSGSRSSSRYGVSATAASGVTARKVKLSTR
jgi:hypothetical protein